MRPRLLSALLLVSLIHSPSSQAGWSMRGCVGSMLGITLLAITANTIYTLPEDATQEGTLEHVVPLSLEESARRAVEAIDHMAAKDLPGAIPMPKETLLLFRGVAFWMQPLDWQPAPRTAGQRFFHRATSVQMPLRSRKGKARMLFVVRNYQLPDGSRRTLIEGLRDSSDASREKSVSSHFALLRQNRTRIAADQLTKKELGERAEEAVLQHANIPVADVVPGKRIVRSMRYHQGPAEGEGTSYVVSISTKSESGSEWLHRVGIVTFTPDDVIVDIYSPDIVGNVS